MFVHSRFGAFFLLFILLPYSLYTRLGLLLFACLWALILSFLPACQASLLQRLDPYVSFSNCHIPTWILLNKAFVVWIKTKPDCTALTWDRKFIMWLERDYQMSVLNCYFIVALLFIIVCFVRTMITILENVKFIPLKRVYYRVHAVHLRLYILFIGISQGCNYHKSIQFTYLFLMTNRDGSMKHGKV